MPFPNPPFLAEAVSRAAARTGVTGRRPLPSRAAALKLALALLAAGGSASAASAAGLELEVAGITSAEGRLMVAVFPSEERFRVNPVETRVLDARPGSVQVRFPGLPAGRYAVAVFHDRNGNGVLDTNLLGIPSEPAAFSGEPARMGPSSWAQASFPLPDTGASVLVRLPK
jgi:uncharacterized protein (DUF2141 family)